MAVDDEQPKKKGRPWWKTLTKYMFSHIGLTILVLLYCLIGGFLFQAIEEPAEIEKKRLMNLEDSKLQKEIDKGLRKEWLMFKQDNVDEASFKQAAEQHLKSLVPQFVGTARNYPKYDGTTHYQQDWDILKSFLFAVSIVTTIGYGHIVPHTSAGQLVTIVYALVGIPLMLMCLANLGDLMANGIRYLYARVFCRACVKPRNKGKVADINQQRGSRPGSAWSDNGSQTAIVGDADDKDWMNVSIPITLTFLICILYIGAGTVIFSFWEDWSFIASAYFSFITVSTIGFGDLVPGTDGGEGDAHLKMGIVSLYMLVGVAMLAMAISLVQEEIVAKFKWVGMKMGIIKPEVVEEDMDEDYDEDDESTDEDERRRRDELSGKKSHYQPPQAPADMGRKKRNRKKRNKDRDESSNEDDSFEDSDLDDFDFKHDVDNDVAHRKKKILAA